MKSIWTYAVKMFANVLIWNALNEYQQLISS